MIKEFETSAFLAPLGSRDSYYSAWERYRVSVSPEEWKRIQAKREELAEQVSRGEIPNARLRQHDRRIVKRFSI